MARGGPIARRREARNNKVRLEKNRSDESDEDYTVGEDELVDTEDEYCSSLAADDETDESLGEFVEEDDEDDEELEEGWVNMNVNKAVKSIGRNSSRRRRNNGAVIPRKEEHDEDDEDEELEGWVNMNINKGVEPKGCNSFRRRRNNGVVISRKEDDDEDDEDEELEEGWVDMNGNTTVKPIGRNSYRRRRNNGDIIRRKKKSAYVSDDDDDDDDFSLSCEEKGDNDTSILCRQEAVNKGVEPKGCNSFRRRRNNGVVISRKEDDDEDDEDEELEEGWVDMNVNTTVKPIGRNSYRRRRNNGDIIRRKKKSAYVSDDDDDDDFSLSCEEKGDNDTSILCRQEAVNIRGEKTRKKTRISSSEKSRKKAIVSYREEKDDGDSDNSDEEDSDEEFAPDEVDDDDDDDYDDEESHVMKKNKEVCLSAHIGNGKKRKRNVKAWRKNKRRKPINGKKFQEDVRQKRKVTKKGRRKKTNANSDPDFVSSDYEYTISEEEKEQIREAGIFCRRSTTNILTFDSLKANEEEDNIVAASQRKRQERKGKEKVVDTKKIELAKQVCGICLSEEGKRSVRGILNCCSHFFCFACIMEWSKVESRCPLCKQRFVTISRTACSDGSRHVLKDDAVILIPECDQVYQPSEEELRGYLYPYENVLCSECHHGGDDALMLLCDLCDSPAHTYCVGLGREVPEGSWYCDGCRPTALFTSPISQSLNNNNSNNNNNNNNNSNNPTHPDTGVNNNSGSSPVRENFDLNELYVPETPLTQVNRGQSPPRYSSGDPTLASASTLFERRRIHRTVQQLLNNRGTRSNVTGINLFGSRIVSRQALPAQVLGPQNIYNNNHDYRLYGWEGLRQEFNHRESTSTDYYAFGRVSHSELSGIGHQQLHPCNSRSNTGAEDTITSSTLQGHLRTPF